jgi:hypothetical protein
MVNLQILDNNTHRHIKVNTSFDQDISKNINSTLIFPTEIKEAQRDYPILFVKSPETGKFQSVALLGLVADENLYVNHGWQASYIPAMIQKGPFTIGFEEKEINGQTVKTPVIAIDIESSQVNDTKGVAIFLDDGQPSPYLLSINNTLKTLHEGAQTSQHMFDTFLKYDLIEPVVLSVELNNGQKITLEGNYTINEQKLSLLQDDTLAQLQFSGLLPIAYFIASSLDNVQRLVDFKNKH